MVQNDSKCPTDETVTWKSYHPGKLRTKRLNKEGILSRAYIAFKSEAQLVTFSRAYDGHMFRDKAGKESHAVVEYAPFQKVPAEKKKTDARNNTIDKDYVSFLETLKGGAKTESTSLEALIAASHPPPPPTTTPLLEALKAEKSAKKDKDMILRNHAHYKDPAVSGSSSKKEDTKKAAVAAADSGPLAQAAKPESPASTSKKVKKVAAPQKVSSHGGQGQGFGSGKGVAATGSATATPSGAKSPAPAPATSVGSGPGQAPPAAVTTETAGGPSLAQGPGQRKNRPTALNGAGVVSAGWSSGSSDRKRRDKGGESGAGRDTGTGRGSTESSGPGKAGKQKRRDERSHPPEVVPSILQRPAETASPDVVTMQRPQSSRGTEGSAVHRGSAGGPSGR
ncbi:Smg-4/UPF3 family domain containing protein [Tylopilus felleus]